MNNGWRVNSIKMRIRSKVMHPLYHHLPILEVLIPFFASSLCVLIGRKDVSWFIAVLASFCSLMVAFGLLILVMGGTSISYHIGGWAPPYGIEYVVDSTNALFLVLVAGIGTIVLFYSKNHLKNEKLGRQSKLLIKKLLKKNKRFYG